MLIKAGALCRKVIAVARWVAGRSHCQVMRGALTVGARLAGEGVQAANGDFVTEYISISAVTATYGFALTASHLEEPQVTKGS
ncbi:hypothetical protein QLG10_14605, partial [Pseudomonas sp. V98_8]|uniref:hypothetical protein n=1 Tax=Pseudomonas sp. V98_8 TaxID=3044228 RepID=UPI00249F180D